MKARMEEMNITQRNLAEMLGISPPRVSEYLSGKSEPTLQVARRIQQQLNIDASVILGAV
jgi:HTH-type transcriptional regulator/antitoxin HigA